MPTSSVYEESEYFDKNSGVLKEIVYIERRQRSVLSNARKNIDGSDGRRTFYPLTLKINI